MAPLGDVHKRSALRDGGMGENGTAVTAFVFAAALGAAAIRINRRERHPTLSALFWACAVTIVVWGFLLWRAAA